MSEHWPQKNWTPLRWEIKHGGKREDLLEFDAALVKDSVRTLSSVWKHYPNDTAVGRQTYAAVWIQPNFFPRLRLSWNISTHAFIGGVELWLLTGAQDVFERDASAKIWFMNWIYLPLFFYYFYLPQPFVPHWFSAGNRYFQSPLGVDAWCIWCTPSVFFHSPRTVKYTCKQRWRTVLKRLCLKCYFSSFCVALAEGDEESSLPTTANLWRRIPKASLDTCSVDTAAAAPDNFINDSNLLMESCELNDNVAACVFFPLASISKPLFGFDLRS